MTSPSGTCPRCSVALEPVVSPVGLRLRCPRCNGQAAAESVVARLTSSDEARALLLAAAQPSSGDSVLACPWCRAPMRDVGAPAASTSSEVTRVDVCGSCQVVWFDAGELERIPRGTSVRTPAPPRPLACELCGAPCRPDLDAICGYCGQLLAPAQMPTASTPEPVANDDVVELDGLTRSVRWLAKALREGINAG